MLLDKKNTLYIVFSINDTNRTPLGAVAGLSCREIYEHKLIQTLQKNKLADVAERWGWGGEHASKWF